MPEYLAPGVYVEEVDTGAKPIEGVSTSTCGVVGVTERGPANVPVLVTSVGDYVHWFGGRLSADLYGEHRYLPHAIEGFFTNGGKRVYVVRALDEGAATYAQSALFRRGAADEMTPMLLRAAAEGTGSAAAPPTLVVVFPTAPALAVNDWVRVGDGSTSEYRQVAIPLPTASHAVIPVDLPLARSHEAGETATEHTATLGVTFTLREDAEPGATTVVVSGANAAVTGLAADTVVRIGTTEAIEYRLVRDVTAVTAIDSAHSEGRLRLDAPIVGSYPKSGTVRRVNLSAAVNTATIESAAAGSGAFYVDSTGGNFHNTAHLVVVGSSASPTREVRRIGAIGTLAIKPRALASYPQSSLVERVGFAAARTLRTAAVVNDEKIELQPGTVKGLVSGQTIIVDPANTNQTVTIRSVDEAADTLLVAPRLTAAANLGARVIPAPTATTAVAVAGSRVLAVADRIGISEGDLLRVSSGADEQLVMARSLPGLNGAGADGGNVVVDAPLAHQVPKGTVVTFVGPPVRTSSDPATTLVLPAEQGAQNLTISRTNSFASQDTLRVTTNSGQPYWHLVSQAPSATTPQDLTLTTPLLRAHPTGSAVVSREPLFDVRALDAGAWGKRLRLRVLDDPGLVGPTTFAAIVNATTVRLEAPAGVQRGTVLEVSDKATGAVLGDPITVVNIDRTTGDISLAGTGLTAAQQVPGAVVRSCEFTVEVLLLRQPDLATPSRNEQVIDHEVFRHLSLDPRHSNYIEKVIGGINSPKRKWDHRPEGSSLYIRVGDRAKGAAAEVPRLGPEQLVDALPDGRGAPAQRRLEDVAGDDAISAINYAVYLGSDSIDPEGRTGLQSLRNIEEVSIVAIPGRVETATQQGLIDHCELMRYRFAVLDSKGEPDDTISDTQDQRQQFDTKYAALYYPWLAIPDPFPTNPADVRDYAIPPSGHMLGVYARTDIDRGVHKAPANEIVRGITGLRRKINKEQQDILNPYPVNINVIRDFRDNNRGIRVYGGRVITSDPDWKYINVRRLLIFIEASIDRGLQWVVFEPNSEPLWARVVRTISNFLTVVWRNGALEGTSVEEAFFVRCDRTTMTQTDIDNGRLIVQIGVAPVKPAEFVIVRIGLWTARSDS